MNTTTMTTTTTRLRALPPVSTDQGRGRPQASERGQNGSTWWSKRGITDWRRSRMVGRLTRRRWYARQGQVVSLDVQPGISLRRCRGRSGEQGQNPVASALGTSRSAQVLDAMASQATRCAELLLARCSDEIEDALRRGSCSSRREPVDGDRSAPAAWANRASIFSL